MLYKARTESQELLILRYLNRRMELPEDAKTRYLNMEKGFQGEKQFDAMTEELTSDCLVLNDLNLEFNGTDFQLDTLIIFGDKIRVYDVKAFEGNFYYENDKLHMVPDGKTSAKLEVVNPYNQLSRADTLIRKLIQSLDFNTLIESSIVFIHPEFYLYQAPLNKPFIFPGQIQRHLKKIDANSYKLTQRHYKLAEKLVSLHSEKTEKYAKIPEYSFDVLHKGIICEKCHSFEIRIEGSRCICGKCRHHEKVESAVMRSVEEFKVLFPGRKITTNDIYEWCRIISVRQRIQRILDKSLTLKGSRRWSYYE